MRRRKALAALAAALTIVSVAWLLSRTGASGRHAGGPAPNRAWDTAHEKIFLAGQLQRNPTHAPILLRLAQIERSAGNLQGAREYLKKAVAAGGGQVDILLELGLVDSEMGDLRAAEAQNRAVLQIDNRQPDALYNLGAIAANRGDLDQARHLWTDAIRSGGTTDAAAKAKMAVERLP
ncbi:exported hypothetical protein [Candidatus Sulfopaludibacter sp. SbA4]|nr:exported hypothetical protein [Candidatus Sulfopaludibacter sp. SbA4]